MFYCCYSLWRNKLVLFWDYSHSQKEIILLNSMMILFFLCQVKFRENTMQNVYSFFSHNWEKWACFSTSSRQLGLSLEYLQRHLRMTKIKTFLFLIWSNVSYTCSEWQGIRKTQQHNFFFNINIVTSIFSTFNLTKYFLTHFFSHVSDVIGL